MPLGFVPNPLLPPLASTLACAPELKPNAVISSVILISSACVPASTSASISALALALAARLAFAICAMFACISKALFCALLAATALFTASNIPLACCACVVGFTALFTVPITELTKPIALSFVLLSTSVKLLDCTPYFEFIISVVKSIPSLPRSASSA